MDIWVCIRVNEDLLGECDNPDKPSKGDIRAILHEVEYSDIVDYYDNSDIVVIGREEYESLVPDKLS
jgi:hypothetical protein